MFFTISELQSVKMGKEMSFVSGQGDEGEVPRTGLRSISLFDLVSIK